MARRSRSVAVAGFTCNAPCVAPGFTRFAGIRSRVVILVVNCCNVSYVLFIRALGQAWPAFLY